MFIETKNVEKIENFKYTEKQKKLLISFASGFLLVAAFIAFWVVFGIWSSEGFSEISALKNIVIAYTPIASSCFLVVKILMMFISSFKQKKVLNQKIAEITSDVITVKPVSLKFDAKKLGDCVLENENFVFYKKANCLTCISKKAFGDKEFGVFLAKSLNEYENKL